MSFSVLFIKKNVYVEALPFFYKMDKRDSSHENVCM